MAPRSGAVLPILTTRPNMILPALAAGWLAFVLFIVGLCRAAARQEPAFDDSEETWEIGA